MSSFTEIITTNPVSHIEHLDNHFGEHVYGFKPYYISTDKKSGRPVPIEGPVFRKHKKALERKKPLSE